MTLNYLKENKFVRHGIVNKKHAIQLGRLISDVINEEFTD